MIDLLQIKIIFLKNNMFLYVFRHHFALKLLKKNTVVFLFRQKKSAQLSYDWLLF